MNAYEFAPAPSGQAYQCPVHGEYRPVIAAHPVCPVCADRERQAHAVLLEQAQRQQFIDARNAAAGVPPRYAGAGFKNYRTGLAGQGEALRQVTSYAKKLLAGHTGCLILTGSTGTGKTHLAVALLRNVMQSGRFARYVTSADLAIMMLDAWKRPGDSEKATRQRLMEPDLLIVDEYDLDDREPKRREAVHRVLYDRYDACRPTLLVTNLSADGLRETLGHRLWSRLSESGMLLEMAWADQRRSGCA